MYLPFALPAGPRIFATHIPFYYGYVLITDSMIFD